ncbi:MAG: flavin reductase family protein [Candidatus Zixiibacteriota bacterium]
MTDSYRKIDPREVTDNAFRLIADEWMLITAGKAGAINTMTASWGTLGELWNKKIAICFVRPTRYTYEFMERETIFTLSFFGPEYRQALDICGSLSGRDGDKIAKAGLSPVELRDGAFGFAEARMILRCRKIYVDDLDPSKFLVPEIQRNYPKKDYHRMYIGEILDCLVK